MNNRNILKVIIVFLSCILFVPGVRAVSVSTINPESNESVSAAVSSDIQVPNGRFIHFTGASSIIPEVVDYSNFGIDTFTTDSGSSRKFIYYKNGLQDGAKTVGNGVNTDLARIKLLNAAYYYDNNGKEVRLDITVTLTKLIITPTLYYNTDGDKQNCDATYYYGVFSNAGSTIYSSIRQFKPSTKTQIDFNSNRRKACGANVAMNYKIVFTQNGSSSYAAGDAVYLWRITDLDQPDKTKVGSENHKYGNQETNEGKHYTESIKFNTGFSSNYYIFNSSYLSKYSKYSQSKFVASAETSPEKGNLHLSSVWAFQTAPTSTITWWGSKNVETSILGVDTEFQIHLCENVNGTYYDINGHAASYDDYKKSCACRTVGTRYFDRSANVITLPNPATVQSASCKCFKENGKYYLTYSPDYENYVSKIEYDNGCTPYNMQYHVCESGGKIECGKSTTIKDDGENTLLRSGDLGDVATAINKIKNYNKKEMIKHKSCVGNIGWKPLNGEYYSKDIDRDSICKQVNISVYGLKTEEIKVDFYRFNAKKVYAGGGFSWNGINVTNSNFKWVSSFRGSFNENYAPILKMEKLEDSNNSFYASTSTTTIYSESNCSSPVVINDEYIKNNVFANDDLSEINFNIKASSKSNDVNATGDDVDITNDLAITKGKGKFSSESISSSVKLKNASIDRIKYTVSYTDEFDTTDDKILDGGKKFYIPLRYMDDTFSIKVDSNSNISAIGQKNINFDNATCSIEVEQLLFEKNGDKLKPIYKYRPIKVIDVFNGKDKNAIAEKAQNWAKWYCSDDICNSVNPNRTRIAETYDGCNNTKGECSNSHYIVELNSEYIQKINDYSKSKNYSYLDISNINSNGTSDFVKKDRGFSKIASSKSYCKLGEFSSDVPDGCDGRDGEY